VTNLTNGNSYTYDLNGNMTGRHIANPATDYTLTYDAENRLVGSYPLKYLLSVPCLSRRHSFDNFQRPAPHSLLLHLRLHQLRRIVDNDRLDRYN
jgi:hypothetical protein